MSGLLLLVLLILAPLCALFGCYGSKNRTNTSSSNTEGLPIGGSGIKPEATIKTISSMMNFALALLRSSSNHSENFVISPFSLGAALTIVHDGAKEDTKRELTALLGKGLSPEEVSSLYSSLTAALSEKNSAVITRIANKFFLDKGFKLKPEYQSHVKKTFNAGAVNINFNDGYRAAKLVNSFVRAHTGGTIPQLVSADAFAGAVAVLINAVYFKGEWQTQFNKDATRTKPFHGIGGDRNAEFMCASNLNTRYSLSDDLTVVSLAYKDPSYSLVVFMPTGDFGEWRNNVTAEGLQEAIENLKTGEINLELLKYKIETAIDGKLALVKMGVASIFSPSADLSGISDGSGLCISKVVHRAVIEVSEQGTTAAAATASVETRCASRRPLTIRTDKPFVYVLVKEGYPMFIGTVVNVP